MKSISGKQLARLVEKRGWTLRRVNGSHHIYTHPNSEARLTIPIHGNKSLKIGLQRRLMQIAGLTDADITH